MKLTYLLFGIVISANLTFADQRKVSAELRGVDPDSIVDVIVQYKSAPSGAHHEKLLQRGVRCVDGALI